jgi:acetyltransferase-like isoleucine patch superfamily enzyme
MKFKKIFSYIHFRTILANLFLLPFKDAIKLPIVVSRKTKLKSLKGSFKINSPVNFAMIKVGFGTVGIFDYKNERTILEINGVIIINGKTEIGKGSRISIGEKAILNLGNRFTLTARSTIICFNKIVIGDDCLFSWENTIMDTDFHSIYFEEREINLPRPIIFGNHVWLGMRCSVLKGTEIPNGSVIAANSMVTGKLVTPNAVYGGNPIKLLKQNITWKK